MNTKSHSVRVIILSAFIALVARGTVAAQSNTAFGSGAFASPSASVQYDSAFGLNALNSPTSGNANTAVGAGALYLNTTGNDNTASGVNALQANTTGNNNTANGFEALLRNSTGLDNTADGSSALLNNKTGNNNTATGNGALFSNIGSGNTAAGGQALIYNNTGEYNTAVGLNALYRNTTGQWNTALGTNAGSFLTTGVFNIDIANGGAAGDSHTIRIGTQGTHQATFVAGIFGSSVSGDAVVVNDAGQLGVVMSSARYKRDIREMGNKSADLMKLRPVTFRYKNDPQGTRQYGLVAEEVGSIYPELVSRGSDGQIQTVHYLSLVPMLLNELQKQARENQQQAEQLQLRVRENQRQAAQLTRQAQQMEALTAKLRSIEASVQ
jgi:Chaperone of endosialidase